MYEPKTLSYTTPGTYTWTAPEGVTSVTAEIAGAGGGGGGMGRFRHKQNKAYIHHYAEGGAGGNGDKQYVTYSVRPGQTYTIVVGAGGEAGKPAKYSYTYKQGETGGKGGNSSFASTTALGGNGGIGGNITRQLKWPGWWLLLR